MTITDTATVCPVLFSVVFSSWRHTSSVCHGTLLITARVLGVLRKPVAAAQNHQRGRHLNIGNVDREAGHHSWPISARERPTVLSQREPNRSDRRPEHSAQSIIAITNGRSFSPQPGADAFKTTWKYQLIRNIVEPRESKIEDEAGIPGGENTQRKAKEVHHRLADPPLDHRESHQRTIPAAANRPTVSKHRVPQADHEGLRPPEQAIPSEERDHPLCRTEHLS